MVDVSLRDARTIAERAASLAQADPATAMRLAQEALAASAGEAEVVATARWALGLAERELDHLGAAHDHLSAAAAVADGAGLHGRAARIRLSWSLVLVYQGDTDAAIGALERARPHLQGSDAGHCDLQHALLMTRLGHLDEALSDALRGLAILRRHGDRLGEARLLSNLGVLRVYRGEFAAALEELELAVELAADLGQTLLLARTVHNQAFVLGRRGDVPRSLARYDDAEAVYRRLEDPDPYLAVLDADRAEVLLGAGLAPEARRRAEASLAALERSQNVTDLAEVSLLVARCRLAAGDADGAAAAADGAARRFDGQRRPSWSAMARHVGIAAAPVEDRSLGERALAVADELAAAGWRSAAMQARVLAARSLLAVGEVDVASRELARVAGGRGQLTASERTSVWHATALLRVVRGDRAGARRAARAGLRVVDDHRATLGATELRAHAAAAGVDLARVGLRLAIGDQRPREALRWMESARAVSVLVPPARPPDDDELAAELAQLRVAEAERWTATDPGALDSLVARVRSLEAAIARRTRRVAGGSAAAAFTTAALLDALGDRALLEYGMLDGQLYGLVAASRRVELAPLGPVAPLEREASSVSFSLQRLAREAASESSLAAARRALEHSLSALDEALVAPFRRRLGDRAVVVVPSASIRRLPWGSLPGLAGRPTSVAPSAAVWQRAASVAAPATGSLRAVLAAGPGLPGAAREVRDLGRIHAGATVLGPGAATVERVLTVLRDGAGLAHVAAHGTFRADNPLFSCLVLADGPLTVHDLASSDSCPPWFVLSACDAAAHTSPAGDEILGLGAGLLSIGAANLVAPVTPVPDRATRPLMMALHRRLRDGDRPADALARLGAEPAGPPAERAAQVAFGVLGA